MVNCLLAYPEFPDTFWSFKHALKFVRKRANGPPLGLLTVAAMLPEHWGKRLVDLNVRRLRRRDLEWADCAFISAMAVQRQGARQLIERCKEAGLTVVAGGPLFTAEHQDFPHVDHIVLGEAEAVVGELAADLEARRARRLYEPQEFPDIRQSPVPLWELADQRRYASMNIQYSRGCPFNCEFCNVTALFGHRPRTKSPHQVVAELDALYRQGWRDSVFFVDDNFIGNKRQLKHHLLPALIRWRRGKRGIVFNTEASIDLADDPQLMDMMVQAGFNRVFVGIETPDEESLAECSKGQNRNRDLVEDVKRIQRAGLIVEAGFIVGFDHDTPSVFQKQIDFIQRSGIAAAMVGLLQAMPGTRLFERLKSEGRVRGKSTGDGVDGTTNIVPRMSIERLREGYKRMLEQIYSPQHYYQRVRTFLREYQPPAIHTPIDRAQLMAFARSIVRLGILGKERVQYWKLLAWTWFRRRELLPLAVKLSILGHHFRKVSEMHIL
ncbi:MAG: B12-binding domain-containing radical SAM protein [Candidatus Brocadiia bacterium]